MVVVFVGMLLIVLMVRWVVVGVSGLVSLGGRTFCVVCSRVRRCVRRSNCVGFGGGWWGDVPIGSCRSRIVRFRMWVRGCCVVL